MTHKFKEINISFLKIKVKKKVPILSPNVG